MGGTGGFDRALVSLEVLGVVSVVVGVEVAREIMGFGWIIAIALGLVIGRLSSASAGMRDSDLLASGGLLLDIVGVTGDV